MSRKDRGRLIFEGNEKALPLANIPDLQVPSAPDAGYQKIVLSLHLFKWKPLMKNNIVTIPPVKFEIVQQSADAVIMFTGGIITHGKT